VSALSELIETGRNGEADAVVGDAQPHGVPVALQRDHDLARPAVAQAIGQGLLRGAIEHQLSRGRQGRAVQLRAGTELDFGHSSRVAEHLAEVGDQGARDFNEVLSRR